MRLPRFLLLTSIATLLALGYVHQQTEIFSMAYTGQKRLTVFQELLDENTVLRYNIQKNASLITIGDRFSGDADFQMPDSFRTVSLRGQFRTRRVSAPVVRKDNLLARILGVDKQAEARTINPQLDAFR